VLAVTTDECSEGFGAVAALCGEDACPAGGTMASLAGSFAPSSTIGYGVMALAFDDEDFGVMAGNQLGTGVYGSTKFGTAINGRVLDGGDGWAGYFEGDVHVTGTITQPVSLVKIDHPTDPENRYLYQSLVESDKMMSIYGGVATLDAAGEAVVSLDDWVSALNGDFRYQLTCIGGYAQVYIAEEISDNRFKIAGGTPGLKVSWQVTGVRKDAWANANRVAVEQPKPAHEKGLFLHPEVLGYPAERGVDFGAPTIEDLIPAGAGEIDDLVRLLTQ
jgi:hypothetical protein